MILIYLVYGAALGLCIGSFLVCWYWRKLNKKNLFTAHSYCEACGAKLTVRDLVPVLSYVISKGRCRHCGEKISGVSTFAEIYLGVVYTFIIAYSYKLLAEDTSAVSVSVLIIYLVILSIAAISDMVMEEVSTFILLLSAVTAIYATVIQKNYVVTAIAIILYVMFLGAVIYYDNKHIEMHGVSKVVIGGADIFYMTATFMILGWVGLVYVTLFASLLAVMWFAFERTTKLSFLVHGEGIRLLPFILLATMIFLSVRETLTAFMLGGVIF